MKKLLLGLGAVTAVVAPITAVVACGDTAKKGVTLTQDQLKVNAEQTLVSNLKSDASLVTVLSANAELPLVDGKRKPLDFTQEVAAKLGIQFIPVNEYIYRYIGTTTGVKVMVIRELSNGNHVRVTDNSLMKEILVSYK